MTIFKLFILDLTTTDSIDWIITISSNKNSSNTVLLT